MAFDLQGKYTKISILCDFHFHFKNRHKVLHSLLGSVNVRFILGHQYYCAPQYAYCHDVKFLSNHFWAKWYRVEVCKKSFMDKLFWWRLDLTHAIQSLSDNKVIEMWTCEKIFEKSYCELNAWFDSKVFLAPSGQLLYLILFYSLLVNIFLLFFRNVHEIRQDCVMTM